MRASARAFLDGQGVYDLDPLVELRAAAAEQGVDLAEGVYTGWSGPAFETAAEIQ